LQVNRIAKARNFNSLQKNHLFELIHIETEHPQYGILGEERINVLKLNIELDKFNENKTINN
jgi:potassium-transporting ATPase KdpC subunit